MTAALSDSLLLFGLDLGKLLEGGLPGLGAIAMEGSNGFACPGFEGLVGLGDELDTPIKEFGHIGVSLNARQLAPRHSTRSLDKIPKA